jgi:hypothetical protein
LTGLNTEASYDWKGERWTVPINLGYSEVTKIGNRAASVSGGLRVFAEAPDDGPDWGLRVAVTLLFPN